MKSYICTVCGYIYDPAVGDPDGELGFSSGISPMIGYARFAESAGFVEEA